MAVMRSVGNGHTLPPHAHVRATSGEYLVELDLSDFTETELTIDVLGAVVMVRGDQRSVDGDADRPFRLHEHLEESFRLPDDAEADRLKASFVHGRLELHAPRKRLVARTIPIERKAQLINPNAEPC
jgi:HSP20 family molecular chaperone IbpA